jgi:outer membrane immunogenic protein
MRKSVILLLLAGTIATPAFAQESAPFSGPRIEGIIGYDHLGVEGEGADGINYGAAVGYDLQRGNGVFGIEGEIGDSSSDACVADTVITGDELCARTGRDLYIGGRAGAVVGRNLLIYGKAGYSNARVRLDYEDGTAATAADFSAGDNLDGIRVGAGLEYALSSNAYLKTEYRYSNYEQGFDRHQVVGGFGFRF